MKPIQEYSCISLYEPQLFFWSDYDPKVKYECSCSALVTSTGLVFIDPLPLAEPVLEELVKEAILPPVAILLTSGNHQRESLALAKKLSIPITAPHGAGEDIIADIWFESGEEVLSLSTTAHNHSGNPFVEYTLPNHQDAPLSFNQRVDQPTAYSLQPTASIRPVGRIVTIALPGFGPGETAFFYQGKEKSVLMVGDALTNAGSEGLLILPKKYCENRRLAMKSLSALKQFSPDILITAHGAPIMSHAAERLHGV
ncbi:MAG: hypothetical protein A3F67_10210 [Verrucomicrobia bacterium RIFCSPHIGHO2_12_FULL_41_10]|nr:MAG: hypothetical protein A3F67_10210 [Verrucomicrobia bacterium RIFCSPHIGHO2_12_FULL_41_10]HLB33936.1 hypothetical protein [Chthoniobacterales bacterium]